VVEVMMMAVAAVGAVHPVDDPVEGKAEHDEDDAQDALPPHPAFLGDAPIPPHYLALEDRGVLGVSLAPWVKRIYNDVYR